MARRASSPRTYVTYALALGPWSTKYCQSNKYSNKTEICIYLRTSILSAMIDNNLVDLAKFAKIFLPLQYLRHCSPHCRRHHRRIKTYLNLYLRVCQSWRKTNNKHQISLHNSDIGQMLPILSSFLFLMLILLTLFSFDTVHFLCRQGFEISWILWVLLPASRTQTILICSNPVPAETTNLNQMRQQKPS